MFDALQEQPPDSLLALITLCRKDPRPHKLDLGVGVYRDDQGQTPIMSALKSAERHLLDVQTSKSYLGPEGDERFVQALAPVALGEELAASGRLVGVQTPGGGGALRLAAELIALARPEARVWVGAPTWPNHEPILASARLRVARHAYFDVTSQTVQFNEMMSALSGAVPGDVVLLHGCCHNPTGADLVPAQWRVLAEYLAERRLLPLIDFAYQGLGHGLDVDREGLRVVLDAVPEALVAYSCDKNFAVYRDRVGALFAQTRNPDNAPVLLGNLLALARVNWSMPPDHGAAAVRIVLESVELRQHWRAELEAMCGRLRDVRRALAPLHPMLAKVAEQNGMFALLPLRTEEVRQLRMQHGVYMADSGRINVAGLRLDTVGAFAVALAMLQRPAAA